MSALGPAPAAPPAARAPAAPAKRTTLLQKTSKADEFLSLTTGALPAAYEAWRPSTAGEPPALVEAMSTATAQDVPATPQAMAAAMGLPATPVTPTASTLMRSASSPGAPATAGAADAGLTAAAPAAPSPGSAAPSADAALAALSSLTAKLSGPDQGSSSSAELPPNAAPATADLALSQSAVPDSKAAMAAVFGGLDGAGGAATAAGALPAAVNAPALPDGAAESPAAPDDGLRPAKSFAWNPKSENEFSSDDDAVSSILSQIKDMTKKSAPPSFLQLAASHHDGRVLAAAEFLELVGGSEAMTRLASRLRSGGPSGQLKPTEAAMLLQALGDKLEKSSALKAAFQKLEAEAKAADKECTTAVKDEERAAAAVLVTEAKARTAAREAAAVRAVGAAWSSRLEDLEAVAQKARASAASWESAAKAQQANLVGSTSLAIVGEGRVARATVMAHEVEGASARLTASIAAMRKKLEVPNAAAPPTASTAHKVQASCEANLARVAAQELEQSRGARVIQAAAEMLR